MAVRQQEPDFVLAGYVFARQPPLAAILHHCQVVCMNAFQIAASQHVVHGHFHDFACACVGKHKLVVFDHDHALSYMLDDQAVALFRAVQRLDHVTLLRLIGKERQRSGLAFPIGGA